MAWRAQGKVVEWPGVGRSSHKGTRACWPQVTEQMLAGLGMETCGQMYTQRGLLSGARGGWVALHSSALNGPILWPLHGSLMAVLRLLRRHLSLLVT